MLTVILIIINAFLMAFSFYFGYKIGMNSERDAIFGKSLEAHEPSDKDEYLSEIKEKFELKDTDIKELDKMLYDNRTLEDEANEEAARALKDKLTR
jgi:hypothetical protein